MDKFSVLMSTYKGDNPEYLRTSLHSIFNQTCLPDEVVIVKDGSVGGKIQNVIDEFDKNYPNLIVQVQINNNLGLGLALNEGLKVCNNDLVARMDSDDICKENRFERQLKVFKENPDVDIVGSYVKEFVGEVTNVVGERRVPLDSFSINKFARRRDPFNHPAVMYRKSKVFEFGPYRDYRKNQDTALWIDMLMNRCKGLNIPEYLLYFRFDENTYKKRKSWVNTKLLIEIRWKSFKNGFSSLLDFILVIIAQLTIYLLPTSFQKVMYRKVLR